VSFKYVTTALATWDKNKDQKCA